MEECLPRDPRKWNSRHVRVWLREKGFAYSIQNKFFGERIDGEALLLLTSSDIDQLLIDFGFGDKIKIKSYIDKLKSNRYHKGDGNKEKQHSQYLNDNRSKLQRPRKRKRKRYRNDSYDDDNNLFIANSPKKKKKSLFKNEITDCMISNPSILPTDNTMNMYKRKKHNNNSYRLYDEQIERIRRKLKNTNSRPKSIIRRHEKHNKDDINTSNINMNKSMIKNDNPNDCNSNNTNTINKKIRDKRYNNNNEHDTSNHGKRWNKNDLEIMWGLHQKGFSNLQIAKTFKRTECGIMVQIDKRYKDLRAQKDIKEVVELRQKAIKKYLKRQKGELSSDDQETENEAELFQNQDSSSSDDDELVINYFRRNKKHQQNQSNQSNNNNNNNNNNNHQLQQALDCNVKELLGL